MSKSEPITVDLGEEQALLDRFLSSGEYTSPSEVARAGLRALDREAVVFSMRNKLHEAFGDPAPDIPAEDVVRELREHHEWRWAKAPNAL